jgi:hypothetical protein
MIKVVQKKKITERMNKKNNGNVKNLIKKKMVVMLKVKKKVLKRFKRLNLIKKMKWR